MRDVPRVPFARLGATLRDTRFLVTVLILNFAAVPAVVWVLSRLVVHDRALLEGVLIVLLTPCMDYVIVFTGLAGGAKERLLASAPVLMLAQMLLLPPCLWRFTGPGFALSVDLRPFAEACLLLIVAPLLAAALTQVLAKRMPWVAALQRFVQDAMVSLMMLTLAVVVASQISAVGVRLGALASAVPVYLLFATVMVPVGMLAGRVSGMDTPAVRAVVFSGVTRNSLVVMVLLVRLVPRLVSSPSPSS